MEFKQYQEICAVLFDANRMDLIQCLGETSGYQMSLEIKQLKNEVDALKNSLGCVRPVLGKSTSTNNN